MTKKFWLPQSWGSSYSHLNVRVRLLSKYFGSGLVFIIKGWMWLTKVRLWKELNLRSTFVVVWWTIGVTLFRRSIAICANNATIMWVDPFCYHRTAPWSKLGYLTILCFWKILTFFGSKVFQNVNFDV